MDSDRGEKVYDKVLQMVLWGEEKEDVYKRLEVNGFIGREADEIYGKARAERIQTIRGAYVKKASLGLVMTVGGVALFCVFWFIVGVMFRFIYLSSGLLVIFGAYKLLDGIYGIGYAPYKEGSVTEEY